ncbi:MULTISPECIES: DUF4272 domain-containing protein [unclassified Sphingopyxis]|uniref:DUF4272 domain-containing protein n=1 Tax=unclassified Sphingopyxis TaxID=2614943 RepID=UPI0009EBE50E|nr:MULTISPECIES: DUF4272 domain-containing protein [unclassified Sphingopyxis]
MDWIRKLFGNSREAEKSQPISVQLPLADEVEEVFGDQPLRKQWAEDLLRAEGIPINPHLPMIESEAQITLRTPREVAERLCALTMVSFKASEEPDQGLLDSIIVERGFRPYFSPEELAFIDDPRPEFHARTQFSWRCEAAWVLLWALRHVDGQLGLPNVTCNVPLISETVYKFGDLTERGMRSANDILNEADLIYRCHWAVRQSGLDGKDAPAGLHPGVTMERHQALNWLIGYSDRADWDDVTTDT